jgi:gliding motility-associated-like protein
LEAGVYTVQIIDENMCTSRSNVVIAESQKLNILDIANIKAACGENNGAISVDIEGGAEPIQISLNDGIPQLSFSFYDLTPGTYEIHIMDDAGCKNDTSLTVLEEICPIYIPNAFSPNGDGINDQFRIYPHPEFKGEFLNLKIFDRWGSMIFEANDFASDGISWDGLYKGQKLNPAVFVYVIEIMHSSGMIEIRDGDITLLR